MSDVRLEVEARFRCGTCNGTPYKLYRRNTAEHPEIFTHVVWPTAEDIPPPLTPTLTCPVDGAPLVREAP